MRKLDAARYLQDRRGLFISVNLRRSVAHKIWVVGDQVFN